ncbi:transposase [Geosporobacter ferrireducens]|uniref:transposase n=1 Tax=Geosporobacter ferrireducens TaxID=1424294 RepID=UPI0009F62C30|nr:transposase [Geosporobacter ferrireducens]
MAPCIQNNPLGFQAIERIFADFKEKYGMSYTQYRGIQKVHDEAMLDFTCVNMKK